MTRNKRLLLAGIAGVVVAILGTIIVLNFTESESEIERQLVHRYGVDDPQFIRELGIMLGPPIITANHVTPLQNGAEIFPAMLDAIRSAQHSIDFETYIYWSGEVGRQFAAALAERARAGVKVNVLLDWVGSQKIEQRLLTELSAAGVEVHLYHPLRWYNLGRMNNRTHRKLLIVDGLVGFTGGVGISDDWAGNAADAKHWRDSHYRLEGPAVAQMQAAFMDNWIKTTGKVLQGVTFFPPVPAAGSAPAQVFTSSPTGGAESMQLMYLLSITAATRSIDLEAAYFVPDELTRHALLEALGRGVKVRIIVPGEFIDSAVVRKASRADWGNLLRAGARFYEYQPSMFHCKTLIVDSLLVSVGSTNIDNRSFRLNDEANLNVYDREFAAAIEKVFEADLGRTREVSYRAWENRPWQEKLLEKASNLFASQM